MKEKIALDLCLIVLLGVGAQWLAEIIRAPSILLLIAFGILAGPITGILSPDPLFGPLLLPLVSIFVSIILFEGGLSLRIRDLRSAGRTILGLSTVGAAITFLLASLGAAKILSLEPSLSFLLGAILIVTGPTVVGPLLRFARPSGIVSSALRWEGIALDPVGAILAVIVYEVAVSHSGGNEGWQIAAILVRAIASGLMTGGLGAAVVIVGIKRSFIPEHLQSPVTLMCVLAAYVAANSIQGESGLFAVTLFGIVLANQREADVRHVLRFKETLSTLCLAIVFIILGARLSYEEVTQVSSSQLLYVAYLIFVVRPVAVFTATLGTGMPFNERLYAACIAPRGIIAAAVCSVFALDLKAAGFPSAALLVPSMFVIIVSTVVFSSIVARPLARLLRLIQEHPQGILFLGANRLNREIAKAVRSEGFAVTLIDTDWSRVSAARLDGLPALFGNILAPQIVDDIDLGNIGRLCALTSNPELNALACVRFRKIFGKENVYQLRFPEGTGKKGDVAEAQRGRYLFDKEMTFERLEREFDSEAQIKTTRLTPEFDFAAYLAQHGENVQPLFFLPGPGQIEPVTDDAPSAPASAQGVISIFRPPANAATAK